MTIEELKTLILWAKQEKVKSVKVGDTSFELSDLALIDNLSGALDPALDRKELDAVREGVFNDADVDEEEVLMWSSGKNY